MTRLNSMLLSPELSNSSLLSEFKHVPLGFIDVGARGGVHDLVEPFAQFTSVLAFEPDQAECRRLLDLPDVIEPWAEFILEPTALSDKNGPAELVLVSAPTNHSLRSPNKNMTSRYKMDKWIEVGREPLDTKTLDSVIADKYKNKPYIGEFIKLDTQGSEYEIIQGARKTITERTVAIVCEVSFAELYTGQKLFSEIEMLMREMGFSFYGFTPMFSRSQKQLDKLTHNTKERPFYTDAVFFKDPLVTVESAKHFTTRQSKALFCCAVMLGYYDFALELASETWLSDSDIKEKSAIDCFIKSVASIDNAEAITQVNELHAKAHSDPERLNLHIGAFVDKRRENNDFHDVLNTLATPKPK